MTPFLASLLFFAQVIAADPSSSSPDGLPAARSGRRPAKSTAIPLNPFRITIVNATSIPAISLSTKGAESPPEYPLFPQGAWIEGAPRTERTLRLRVSPQGAIPFTDRQLSLPAMRQFLVISGDFGRREPSDMTAPVHPSKEGRNIQSPPDFQCRSYPVELVVKDPCHYRVVNAMPGKTLLLFAPAREGRPRRLVGVLTPGNSLLLKGQPPAVDWLAMVDGKELVLSIGQEGAAGNCLIPFFLRDGKPDFVRVFETP